MASNNNRLTPRQKMINLMYIVLTAMLALNVSSDVLNGFKQVEDGLERSTSNEEYVKVVSYLAEKYNFDKSKFLYLYQQFRQMIFGN